MGAGCKAAGCKVNIKSERGLSCNAQKWCLEEGGPYAQCEQQIRTLVSQTQRSIDGTDYLFFRRTTGQDP